MNFQIIGVVAYIVLTIVISVASYRLWGVRFWNCLATPLLIAGLVQILVYLDNGYRDPFLWISFGTTAVVSALLFFQVVLAAKFLEFRAHKNGRE